MRSCDGVATMIGRDSLTTGSSMPDAVALKCTRAEMLPHVTAAETTSATSTTPSSYADVLRNPRLAILLSGDAISSLGDGMTFVALPVMALRLRGDVPAAFA